MGYSLYNREDMFCCLFQELEKSLNEFGLDWTLNPGDGAFYGPKVQNFLGLNTQGFSNNIKFR